MRHFILLLGFSLFVSISLKFLSFRIGHGYDIHALDPGGKDFVISGRRLSRGESEGLGILAHSDGDVIYHTVVDAILGALGKRDIGSLFPDDSEINRDRNSEDFIREVVKCLKKENMEIVNCDLTVVLEKPKLSKFRETMIKNLARVLEIHESQVNIKARTKEKKDAVGKSEAVECHGVVMLKPKSLYFFLFKFIFSDMAPKRKLVEEKIPPVPKIRKTAIPAEKKKEEPKGRAPGKKVEKKEVEKKPVKKVEEVKKEPVKRRLRRTVVNFYSQYNDKKVEIPRTFTTRSFSHDTSRAVKTIYWNCCSLKVLLDKKIATLLEITKEDPDVLFLAETKIQEKDVPLYRQKLQAVLPNYDSHFTCSTSRLGYSGVCCLAKNNFNYLTVKAGFQHSSDVEGRVLEIETENNYILAVYVPNSGDKLQNLKFRLNDFDVKFSTHLKNLETRKPVICLGDFNVAYRDLDIWNLDSSHIRKSAGTTDEERESFRTNYLSHFDDYFLRNQDRKEGCFTYWSVRAGNRASNHGLRLDYCLGTKTVKTAECFHLDALIFDGDHCPVGVTWLV